jgi:dienelactone hydrolase
MEAVMAEVVLFHHAQGLTPGVRGVADEMRAAGHTVHTPDSFDGHTFDTLDEGIEYASGVGFATVRDSALQAAEKLPTDVVYVGISLGVMAAQQLAQTRPGARGAVFLESCMPVSEIGQWPDGVPVQIHGMDADPFFAAEGDIDAARDLVKEVDDAELFVYPGDRHLFTDPSLSSHDPEAATLVWQRVHDFLARLDR